MGERSAHRGVAGKSGHLSRARVAPSTSELSRSSLFRDLRELLRLSLRLHLRRPLVPMLAVVTAIVVFALALFGGAHPQPGDLARGFALAPNDVEADWQLSVRSSAWVAAAVIPVRIAVVTLIVALVVGRRVTGRSLVRVGARYLLAGLSLFAVFPLALAHVRLVLSPSQAAGAVATLALLAVLAGFAGLSAVWTTAICRAAAGRPTRPLLPPAPVWILAAISTWISVYWPYRLGEIAALPDGAPVGYALGFAAVLAQSVILGGVALATTGSSTLEGKGGQNRR